MFCSLLSDFPLAIITDLFLVTSVYYMAVIGINNYILTMWKNFSFFDGKSCINNYILTICGNFCLAGWFYETASCDTAQQALELNPSSAGVIDVYTTPARRLVCLLVGWFVCCYSAEMTPVLINFLVLSALLNPEIYIIPTPPW